MITARKLTDEEILLQIRNKNSSVADDDIETYNKTRNIVDLRKSVMANRTAMQAIRDRARYSIEKKK